MLHIFRTTFPQNTFERLLLAEIHNLDNKEPCQETDIPAKILNDNIDIFPEFIFHYFNNSTFDATFPTGLNNVEVIPFLKRKTETILKTIVQYAFFLICRASTIKYINASIIYSQNGDVDSVKALVQNTVFL